MNRYGGVTQPNGPQQSSDQLKSGNKLMGYELVESLGRGGMGEVWKAIDHQAGGRLVVLKFVPPEVQRVEEELQRVRDMFQMVHRLNHTYICPLYGMCESVSGVGDFLVMQYLEGETLSAYGRRLYGVRRIFPPAEAVRILRMVAEALDYAHTVSDPPVIHRDIKPSNIMMVRGSDGVYYPRLIDFGLASEIRTSQTRVSNNVGAASGTNVYKSPEQWRSRRQDGRTDQYLLAVVAYEMLCGVVPFIDEDSENLRRCVLDESPEPLELPVPSAMNAAILKALSKERADRFDTCVAFIDAMSGETANTSVSQPATPMVSQTPPTSDELVELEYRRLKAEEAKRLAAERIQKEWEAEEAKYQRLRIRQAILSIQMAAERIQKEREVEEAKHLAAEDTKLLAKANPASDFEYTKSDGQVTITKLKSKEKKVVIIPAMIDGLPVTSIGNREEDYVFGTHICGAFAYCRNLESITIPSSVTSIGKEAFKYCYSLKSITIPSSVTSIGYNTFYGCGKLESVTIPSSVTSFGWEAFAGCEPIIRAPAGSCAAQYAKKHGLKCLCTAADGSEVLVAPSVLGSIFRMFSGGDGGA